MTNTETPAKTNYYKTIQKHLKRQYPSLSKEDVSCLCRETVFAPQSYTVEIDKRPVEINTVRENLADFIERRNAESSFIPYSLDAEIADLIESANCETSSMNEYYRWISATAEIVRRTSDGDITEDDIAERRNFLKMSNERESEILLCLALYEAADPVKNKEKIDMLKFKLARLREMRSIVRNTSSMMTDKLEKYQQKLRVYYRYCCDLLGKKPNFAIDVNSKLNLNNDYTNDEDLSEDFSYLDHLKRIILYMMRKLERDSSQHQRSETENENENQTAARQSQSYFKEGRAR